MILVVHPPFPPPLSFSPPVPPTAMLESTTAAAFIGASVTLVLVIIFMILMVILVRQCLAFVAKRNQIRQHLEQQRQVRAEIERQRRLSVSEPVNPTFDWHHSIRIAGTPPPTYHEAKKLPALEAEEVHAPKSTSAKKKEDEIDGRDSESDFAIHIDNISMPNEQEIATNHSEPRVENEASNSLDNRTASMSIPSQVVITVDGNSTLSADSHVGDPSGEDVASGTSL